MTSRSGHARRLEDLLLAVCVGLVVGAVSWALLPLNHGADFQQFHFAARAWLEWLSLAILSHAELLWPRLTHHPALDSLIIARGELVVLCYFLPCLVMVLRRPNEGDVLAWMERAAERMRPAMRGRPAAKPESPYDSLSARLVESECKTS